MKKSKPSKKDKQFILDLGKNRNAKTKIDSWGEVELKFISLSDAIEFAEMLQDRLSDRDFVVKILFHQLIKPETNYGTFQKLSDENIEHLARVFMENEDNTFRYFKDTGDFFRDFKQALSTGQEKQLEKLGKTTARFKYSLKPALDHTQSMAKIISNSMQSLRPQIDFWQKWAEQNRRVFRSFSNYWAEFQQKYSIAEPKAAQILRKYRWFVTPSLPLSFVFEVVKLGEKQGRQTKAINALFVRYFEENDWRNLETMVNGWKNKPLLKKRYKILFDCVVTIKLTSKKRMNTANVVLPTLITQIDGALTDYMDSKGVSWKGYADRSSKFRATKSKILIGELDNQANDIFLNILFQGSQRGQPLATPFNFNRHKILHGENVRYGRKDYMIRAFMVLDLLANLE